MLTLRQITLSRGNKVLLDKANVSLYEKQKIGLIGHNGCGKSTLFDFILGKLIADTGEFLINPQLSISHLSQQLPDSDEKALDFVLSGDEEYIKLLNRLEQAEQSGNDAEVLAVSLVSFGCFLLSTPITVMHDAIVKLGELSGCCEMGSQGTSLSN